MTGGRRSDQLEAARLYVITPDAEPSRVLELASAALRGGADVIQLRHKSLPRGELLTLGRELRSVVRDALFIVNDHVDIALLSGADGVHLGPDDLTPASARKVAGGRLLIGVSASTLDAVPPEADYVGCGPAFSTPVKPDESNLGQLVAAGVRRACVIRAISEAPDPEQAARRLRAMLTA